jgi:hypothetical protein
MNIIFIIAGLSVLLLLGLSLWMKWRMQASKGRFALTVVSSLFACFTFGLAAMSTSLPVIITSKISEKIGLGQIATAAPSYLVIILTLVIAYFIYKFGVNAIKNWDVSPRVSEIDLAERHLENSMAALSIEKLRLLLKGQRDPVASDAVENWKAKIAEAPKSIEVKDLLRDMLISAIREVRIPENGWRDDGRMWVGEKLGLSNAETKMVLALVFDSLPSEQDIKARIDVLEEGFDKVNGFQIFALYSSSEKDLNSDETITISGCKVRILASRQMILMGLDLVSYAKELISNFENTRVGGTSATLGNSYVDLYVQIPEKDSAIKPLNEAIKGWLKKDSNCHLAITGEYGQGKSTALMKFCIDWAERFLKTGHIGERVPLLIELRGQSPSETDPMGFISAWCARYRLLPQQVLNLIKSGDAILIFEGFDELRNAGKSYFRHQHFNALWRFAYPNTKLIFTGRPNFFLDKEETNRTLRSQDNRAAGGDYYSEVWKLQKLDKAQVKLACRSYEPSIKKGIVSSIENSKDFLEIVSRPSMLPVVATIWPEIEKLQESGHPLTGAELIERYIQAVFSRKEAELERDRVIHDAPSGSRYLLLPKQLRELLTICVAWRMSGLKYKNTIPRSEITEMVREIYDVLISVGKSEGVSASVAEGIVDFEKRHIDENIADKVEAITTEICSAGLLISDAAGGATNLRFPHKQFFEFLIAKAIKITSQSPGAGASKIILKSSSDSGVVHRLINEPTSINYLSECVGQNLSIFFTKSQMIMMYFSVATSLINNKIEIIFYYLSYSMMRFRKSKKTDLLGERLKAIDSYNEYLDEDEDEGDEVMSSVIRSRTLNLVIMFSIFITSVSVLLYYFTSLFLDDFVQKKSNSIVIIFYLSMTFSMMLPLFIKKQGDGCFVLTRFLKSHWRHAGQMPKSNSDALKITLRSLLKGRVIFPDENVSQSSHLEQFLYPSTYFGDDKGY